MKTYLVDLRHLSSDHPTGKAVYTRALVSLLLEKNKVIGFGFKNDFSFSKHKNFSFKKSNKYLHHIQIATKSRLKKATFIASESYITPFFCNLFGTKSIVVVHDLISFLDSKHPLKPKLIEKFFLPRLIKSSKNFFFFSTKSDQKLAYQLFKFKRKSSAVFFPGMKMFKVHNKTKKSLITFNASFFERKNQLFLLKAFSLIKDQINLDLCLVGKFQNPQVTQVQRFIKKHNLENRVIINDYLSDSELNEVLKKTAMLCNPSKIEGFGLQIIEALYRGIPCVLSDIPVFKEVFRNSCIYFDLDDPQDLADKILFLNKNKELQGQLMLNSKSILKKYSFQKTGLLLNNILKKLD